MVGQGKCSVVDTYWQTETGAHVVAPLPGVWPAKPGSATLPFFGVQPAMVNEQVEAALAAAVDLQTPLVVALQCTIVPHYRCGSVGVVT